MNSQASTYLYPGMMDRRAFLVQSLKAMGDIALLSGPAAFTESFSLPKKEYTVGEIMDNIIKEVPWAQFK